MGSLASVLFAVMAAALLGTASVAQRHAALDVPTFGAGDPRLVSALVGRPWWWIGTVASVAGLGLQVLALTLGSIIVVQSVMTSSIVFTTVAERLLLGHRPPARAWVGMGLTALGLAGLLLSLAPTAGASAGPSAWSTLVVAAVCLAGMAAAVAWSRRSPSAAGHGVLGLAAATGLGYGVTAIQLKSVGTQLAAGLTAPLAHPALYVAAVVGPLSILLSQHALQQGRRALAVVSLILVIDPIVGLLGGLMWFGEVVATGAGALAGAGLGVAAMVAGVFLTQAGAPATRSTPVGAPPELVRA
jgi:uncharacterized membrane protein